MTVPTVDANKKQLKKIWFFAYGSRGDIQPYIAVGAALVEKGYHVTLFTSEKYADFATEYGLKGVATEPFIDDSIRQSPELLECMAGGDALRVFESIGKVNDQHAVAKCEVIMAEAKQNGLPDLCLTMPLSTYFGWYFAVKHNIPYLNVMTFAFSYNKEHMHCGLPTLPLGLHYPLFYKLIVNAAVGSFKSYEAYFGTDYCEFGKQYEWKQVKEPEKPMVYLMSPAIASVLYPPKHVPPLARFVGTTVLEQKQQLEKLDATVGMFGGRKAMEEMKAFLGAGPTPIYLGWGSMVSKSPEYMIVFCVRAIYHSQQRAIVLGGVAELSLELLERTRGVEPQWIEYAKKNILFVSHAPHEWLFSHVSATVHHGGAGTSTAAFRGGVPCIITPVLIDQFDFSYVVRKLGVGIGFEKQLQKISWLELGEAIKRVVSDGEMKERAAELGKKLREEDGAKSAAKEIESFWKEYCMTGKFQEIFPSDFSVKDKSSWTRKLVLGALVLLPIAVGIRWRVASRRQH